MPTRQDSIGKFLTGGYDVNLKDEAADLLVRHVEVPDKSYVDIGDIYLCDSRCLCIWAVFLATKPNLDEKIKTQAVTLRLPNREEMTFDTISDLALWATSNALHRAES